MYAYLIIIMLLVLYGLSAYGIGYNNGIKLHSKAITERKARRISDHFIGDGVEDDDFEVVKAEQPIQGERGFWA